MESLKDPEMIRKIIKKKSKTFAEIARLASVSSSTVSNLVADEKRPKIDMVLRILAALGINHRDPDFRAFLEACGRSSHIQGIEKTRAYRQAYRSGICFKYLVQPPLSSISHKTPISGLVPLIVSQVLGEEKLSIEDDAGRIKRLSNLYNTGFMSGVNVGFAALLPLAERTGRLSFSIPFPGIRNFVVALRVCGRERSKYKCKPKHLFRKDVPPELEGRKILAVEGDIGEWCARRFGCVRHEKTPLIKVRSYLSSSILMMLEEDPDISMVVVDGSMAFLLTESTSEITHDFEFEYVAEHSDFSKTYIHCPEAAAARSLARGPITIPFPVAEKVWTEQFNSRLSSFFKWFPYFIETVYSEIADSVMDFGGPPLGEYCALFDGIDQFECYPDPAIEEFPDFDRRFASLLRNRSADFTMKYR